MENKLFRVKDQILWHQIVLTKGNDKRAERTVPLSGDTHEAVDEFAEFCLESGGDRYTSVGTAMNEINALSKDLVDEVDAAEREEEVESFGLMLNAAITLFKALESYYINHFEPRTGTGGD